MAWIIKSSHDGPVIINDLGIMLNRGQMKDLDLLGRDAAERSNDVKVLLAKKLIIELKKDAVTPATAPSNAAAMESLAASVKQASDAMAQTQAQNETIAKQNDKINELSTQLTEQKILTQEVISNTAKIVEAVNKFATDFPVEVRTIKKAMENIKVERGNISETRQEMATGNDVTEAEIKAQERILANKDKKLEKNLLDLGKSVTKNAVEKAEDVDSALDAMDELGI